MFLTNEYMVNFKTKTHAFSILDQLLLCLTSLSVFVF